MSLDNDSNSGNQPSSVAVIVGVPQTEFTSSIVEPFQGIYCQSYCYPCAFGPVHPTTLNILTDCLWAFDSDTQPTRSQLPNISAYNPETPLTKPDTTNTTHKPSCIVEITGRGAICVGIVLPPSSTTVCPTIRDTAAIATAVLS